MDTPTTSWKHPASSPLNAEAHQPTTCVESISPPRVLRLPPPPPHFVILDYVRSILRPFFEQTFIAENFGGHRMARDEYAQLTVTGS